MTAPTSKPVAPPIRRQSPPYDWVDLVIGLYLLLAALAVLGGFLEAGNHSHRVVHAGQFGIGRTMSNERDYNYAWVGIAAGVFWASLAVVMVLLRGIARDARRSADAAAPGALPQSAPPALPPPSAGTSSEPR